MRSDQWEDPGAMERLNWFLCFLLPVGGAKLLEEEQKAKLNGWWAGECLVMKKL